MKGDRFAAFEQPALFTQGAAPLRRIRLGGSWQRVSDISTAGFI